MEVGRYRKRFLPAVGVFLVLWANWVYADLSGSGEAMPEVGFLRVKERVILLQGIQVIAYDALCEDKKGHWPCGSKRSV